MLMMILIMISMHMMIQKFYLHWKRYSSCNAVLISSERLFVSTKNAAQEGKRGRFAFPRRDSLKSHIAAELLDAFLNFADCGRFFGRGSRPMLDMVPRGQPVFIIAPGA